MLYRQHEHNQIGANIGLMAKIHRSKNIENKWYKNQVLNNFELIIGESFHSFVRKEKLFLRPFSLRRRKFHSIFIWFLVIFNTFTR